MSIPSVTRGTTCTLRASKSSAELTTIPWRVGRKSAKICKQTENSRPPRLTAATYTFLGPYWCVSVVEIEGRLAKMKLRKAACRLGTYSS